MTRKLSFVIILSLLLFAFLATTAFSKAPGKTKNINMVKLGSMPKAKLAGAERAVTYVAPGDESQSLGFDEINSASPGLQLGTTTYDYQSNCRMNRQVGSRGMEGVHFDWMYQTDSVAGGLRGTGYNYWDPDEAELRYGTIGCDVHPRLGSEGASINYSGYVGLDVDTEGKVNLSCHHDEGAGYASTIWFDYAPGACFFSPYRSRLPDTTMVYFEDPNDFYEYIWPQHEYQVWDGDTVTHLIACQYEGGAIDPSIIGYFRRVGSDTLGAWDYPPMAVDTLASLTQCVSASQYSGKVALVWGGNIPEIQGDGESSTTGSQRQNDLFIKKSDDLGATWGPDINVTANAVDEGWFLHGDISSLYGTDDYLHIIWDAREVIPLAGGTYTHFYGCRLFHWSDRPDQNNQIRVVKDANWDLPDDDYCFGGAWNEMSIVKMSLSECDGRMYAIFCQFNDIFNGIDDDCHEDAFTAGVTSAANGEVWMSVSDNWGYNWDLARNLTNTYTPHCDTEEGSECESDVWPSAARHGMEVVTGDFSGTITVDPTGSYNGSHYLDITYINDKYPGGCVQDAGVWTTNPVHWMRLACVTPIPNPVLSIVPSQIGDPAWTKPGIQLDTTIRLENIGNAALEIFSITPVYVSGSGWLSTSASTPFTISHLDPNYFELGVQVSGTVPETPTLLEGYLEISSTSLGGSIDSFPVTVIVADSVQFPEWADIRTNCKRLIWNNAGNMGNDGALATTGGYNMDFFDDCDTTNNTGGANDNSRMYLYDASPFVLRTTDAGDTLLSCAIFDAGWLTDDGFRPLEGLQTDTTPSLGYQWGYTGDFATQDTAVKVSMEFFAPTHADSCSFIILKQIYSNTSGEKIEGMYVGDLFDWDIPSDTSVRNGSNYDAPGGEDSYDVFYCYGAEYSADSIENNDCVLADQRMGGISFYNGYLKKANAPSCAETDSLENPIGPWWTHLNADWVSPTGNFLGSQLYRKMEDLGSAWEPWEATITTNPDSQYNDLNMVSTFGKFDLDANDSLVFVKILTTTYEGLSGLMDNITKARAWIEANNVFAWPEFNEEACGCCEVPGDANNNGSVNILDITFEISYLYKGGPAPACNDEADANGNGTVNILDITYLISYLYKGGPDPVCGQTGNK